MTDIIKKRGRKPKNYINDTSSDLTVVSVKKKNKEILIKEDIKKIDIELSKNLDFTDDDIINTVQSNNDSNNSNIWLNKYQPTTLNQVIGNKDQINKITNWLTNFDTNNNHNNHAAIISGGHGIGKNLIARLALIETGYQIKNIYSTSLKNKNIVSEIIHSYAKTKNVYNLLNQSNNLKYAIIIDDTESITLSSEKEHLIELFKLNSQNKYFPLIFISNLQHSKLINNLKKISLEITLFPPDINLIKIFIDNILNNENISFDDEKLYFSIIRFCQSDIRRLIFVLQDLYYTYSNNKEKTKTDDKLIISSEMFKKYQHMSQKKDIDSGLYIAAKSLLDNYKNINECLQLYETEKVLLPLTIYENYYKKIFKQKLKPSHTLEIMSNITNFVSIGDVIETNIYSDQNWFLQNIHGFYTCAYTSYVMNLVNKNTKQNINYDLVFSADLNKTSSKNINKKKNILTLQSKFKNKNIEDILYINKIFFEFEKRNMNSQMKNIQNTYNLNNKNIQIALKIDKTYQDNSN